MKYPPGFPGRLKPAAVAALMKANRAFPNQEQRSERVKQVTFALCEISCEAAESGEWSVDLVLEGIAFFLRSLCEHENVGVGLISDRNRFTNSMMLEIGRSDEWFGYIERLAEIGRVLTKSTKPDALTNSMTKQEILKILEEKGLTRSKWAALAGVDPSVVYDYLEGKSRPRAESRKALAEIIGLSLSEFPDLQTKKSPRKPNNTQ